MLEFLRALTPAAVFAPLFVAAMVVTFPTVVRVIFVPAASEGMALMAATKAAKFWSK
jgi:hypothetical protein